VEVAAARNSQSLEDSYFLARGGIASTNLPALERRYVPALRQAGEEEPTPLDLGVVTGSLGAAFTR